MLILALDTTTRAGSVAIVRGESLVHEHSGDPAQTHGQRLPGELMTACERAGVGVADLELLAVAAGPGSFTGLRIGIASIQGLAVALGRRVVPISTLEALALTAPPPATRVVVWMDAQRGEVFAQVFDLPAGAGEPRALVDPISAKPSEALGAHAALIERAAFVGDGAIRYRETIAETHGAAAIRPDMPALAGAIGRLAARRPDRAVLPHAVVPIYVRRPDAEIARDRQPSKP